MTVDNWKVQGSNDMNTWIDLNEEETRDFFFIKSTKDEEIKMEKEKVFKKLVGWKGLTPSQDLTMGKTYEILTSYGGTIYFIDDDDDPRTFSLGEWEEVDE